MQLGNGDPSLLKTGEKKVLPTTSSCLPACLPPSSGCRQALAPPWLCQIHFGVGGSGLEFQLNRAQVQVSACWGLAV